MKPKDYKFIFSILVAAYCLYYVVTLGSWHFIDTVDLVIHEAGHVVFFPFGTFLYIAGGCLMQLIMPSLFIGYFYQTNQRYSGSLVMYWLAINFFSVAHYAADAVKMQLPLLGGDESGHDWHNLLAMTHLLPETNIIAGLIYACGFAVIAAGLYFSYISLYSDIETF